MPATPLEFVSTTERKRKEKKRKEKDPTYVPSSILLPYRVGSDDSGTVPGAGGRKILVIMCTFSTLCMQINHCTYTLISPSILALYPS
jgi:hypothetical protein